MTTLAIPRSSAARRNDYLRRFDEDIQLARRLN